MYLSVVGFITRNVFFTLTQFGLGVNEPGRILDVALLRQRNI